MRGSLSSRRLLSDVSRLALAAALFAAPNAAFAASCTWLGGTGLWTSGGGWSCAAVPGSGDSVDITTASSVVNLLNTTQSSGPLTLSNGNQLNLDNTDLNLFGAVSNDGTITIAHVSRLLNGGGGAVVFSGGGTIVLDNSTGSAQYNGNGGTTTFGASQTVRGSGQLGVNNTIIINNGLISADAGTGIDLDPSGGNGGATGLTNTGVIQANGKTLAFEGGRYDNTSGVIKAINGGTIALNNDVRVIGGALSSDATSTIAATGATQYLQGVTLTAGSRLNLSDDDINLSGGLTNNGTITVAHVSRLLNEAGGAVAIDGTGVIVLDNSTGTAQINGNGGTLTLGSGQILRGSGQLGVNNTIIVNNGLISADAGTGIDLDPSGGNGGAPGLTNNSIMQAKGTTLAFEGGRYDNTSGVIKAINGGTIALNNDVRIIGGTLSSDATSTITASSATQYLQGVTLTAGSRLNLSADDINLSGGLTNNGTITVAHVSRLLNEAGGAVAIDGTGVIVLDNSTGTAQINGNGGTLTLGSGQIMRGSGQLGVNNTIIVNNGLISADAGTGISIDAAGGSSGIAGGVGADGVSGLVNNSTIQAKGSTLTFEGGRYDNNNGVIQAINGSTIVLNNDARIIGGDLTAAGANAITASNQTQYLQGVTLTTGTNLNLSADDINLSAGLTNNGTITVAHVSRLLNEAGQAVAIGGTGTIVLDNSSGTAQIDGAGGKLTLGGGQIVRGSGQVGVNNTIIVNNGLISADVATGGISIDASGGSGGIGGGVGADGISGLVNNSTIQASGSTLTFEGGRYDNNNGVIQAINGSTIVLNNDARIIGGDLTATGANAVTATNQSQFLQGVTLTSGTNLNLTNDDIYLNTGITNNGVITLAHGSRLLNEGGAAVSYGGTGVIVLDNSSGYAQINGAGGKVTIGAAQTVRGSGEVGVNNTVIVNNGLISADVVKGGITIDASGGNGGIGGGVGVDGISGLVNNNTIQADGGALTFDGGRYDNTNGLIQAINGGTVVLNGDARIIGGDLTSDGASAITATNQSQFLQAVTLTTGTNLNLTNDDIYINTGIINNGTITLAHGSRLLNEGGAAVSYDGTGVIVLDDSAGTAQFNGAGGKVTIGAAQTVRGSGDFGVNNTVIVNNGLISADVAGRGISIDGSGGNGGVGGGGVGTGGNAALYNTGMIQAAGGGAVSFEGGLYENAATGELRAQTGSTVTFHSDASLYNLQAGGVLNKGVYTSTTTGAQSTLDLRSNAADSIVTIGTGGSGGTDTVVKLSGANSVLDVIPFGGGTAIAIDNTLTGVDKTGKLQLLNGRNMTITAGGGAFTNAGVVELGASTFGATSFSNSGTTFGNGTVTVAIGNTGTVNAKGGVLNTQAITGTTGTISTDATGTLNLGGTSSAGLLINNGHLGLGANTVTVTNDYQNANFGTGNAFAGHAHVTGTGLILASSATMDLSGPALSGGTLNVGNVRIGGSSSTTLTVTNNGAETTLRGAVQNTNAPSVALANADFTLNPNGGSSTTTISYTGTTAGSLAGQSLKVVNNFDNVAAKTVNLAGNVYQIAVAASQPSTVTLAAQRVGGAASTSTISIANVAPNTAGFTESLSSTASTSSPFKVNGAASVTTANLTAGSSQNVTVGLGTGTAGAFSGAVGIANTSIPVTGSGFAPLALAGQSITVKGNVYATAVANLSSATANFGPVRQNTANVTASVGVTNGASGALTDNLTTAVGATPANVSASVTPTTLAAGQSGNVAFLLNTSTAGLVTGSTALNFTSTDSELAPLALASQTVTFTGTVTKLAQASLLKASGAGTFSGAGASYTLDLGTITKGSGSVSTDLGVLNSILNSSYSEALGGSFAGGTQGGFSFAGVSFSGLTGGASTAGDLLTFNYSGLGAGLYADTITLNAYSHFAGLADQTLSPITLHISADIQGGGVAAVPEPAIWAQLLVGFGLLGSALRWRRQSRTKERLAA